MSKKNIPELNAAKAAKILASPIRFEGRTMTRAAWLEYLVAHRYELEKISVPKHSYDRAKYNRMSGDEQAAYDRKMKETKEVFRAVSPSGDYIELQQTEADYFRQVASRTA